MAKRQTIRQCDHCGVTFARTINLNRPVRFCSRQCANRANRATTPRYAHRQARRGRKSAEYRAWCHAKERCTNPRTKGFADYGGRGITMCRDWSDSFEAFFAHIGAKPSARHQLDRIRTEGHYEPGNVRWATTRQQMQNRRMTNWQTYQGETQCLAEWSRRVGLPPAVLGKRLRRGWTLTKSLTTPLLTGSDRH